MLNPACLLSFLWQSDPVIEDIHQDKSGKQA